MISIVIVSYNVSALLRDCIRSVYKQNLPLELIVVDNQSTDDSVSMLRAEFPQVKLIVNDDNVGFSEANNQGMRVSSGNYILLLNPDTEIKDGTLQNMLDYAQSASNDFLLGPRLLNSDGTLQVSAWKQPSVKAMIAEAFYLHRLFGVSEYPSQKFQSAFSPGMISGAAMFFPRALFEKTKGLDPQLFWMEDADFSVRVDLLGAKLVYDPNMEVIHHSGQSSKKNLKRAIANQLLSKLKFYRKHQGATRMWLASPFCFFHIITRLIFFSLAGIFSQPHAEKAAAYGYTFRRYFQYLFTGDQRIA
jgi:GT2 family glycosyltransferase